MPETWSSGQVLNPHAGRGRGDGAPQHGNPDPDADRADGDGADDGVVADLAGQLSELARALEHQQGNEDTLVHVVSSAIDLIPGVEEASISLVTGRRSVEARVPSGPLPIEVDGIQSETGQGPCLDAAFQQQTVHVPDMVSEQRWPLFARRAAAAGAASMLSFQLFVDGDNLGALNLYARSPHAFDEESEHVGLLFAAHAAVAVAGVRQQQHLLAGLASRDLIGQAKGILMERYGISGDVAFSLLVRVSRTASRKLRDVAEELVTTRELAGQPRDPGTPP